MSFRPVARDAGCIQVVAVVGSAVCPWFGVVYLPRTSCAVRSIIHKGEFLGAQMAVTVRAVVDAVQLFVRVSHSLQPFGGYGSLP